MSRGRAGRERTFGAQLDNLTQPYHAAVCGATCWARTLVIGKRCCSVIRLKAGGIERYESGPRIGAGQSSCVRLVCACRTWGAVSANRTGRTLREPVRGVNAPPPRASAVLAAERAVAVLLLGVKPAMRAEVGLSHGRPHGSRAGCCSRWALTPTPVTIGGAAAPDELPCGLCKTFLLGTGRWRSETNRRLAGNVLRIGPGSSFHGD